MGDLNQLIYAKAVFQDFRGRILEIGSKDYGNTQPFRELFPGCEYTGVDLEAGKNVDFVVDLEQGPGPLAGQKFDLVIICSVLEHTPRPWVLARHVEQLLAEEGALMSCHP
ncbi:MAG: class I SAM-dependent methyltransferase [Burkholderiales bacterium]